MSTTTHALVFTASDSTTQIRDVHTAPPQRGEVTVQIEAAGVCHSDLHILNGKWPVDQDLVLGHEGAGVITAVGEGVEGLSAGQHVVLSWFAPCRKCRECASGRSWLCLNTRAVENTMPDGTSRFAPADAPDDDNALYPFLGLGAFSSLVTVPESAVVPVPDALPLDIGALLGCSITTGIGAVLNTADVPAGATAIVVGCGGVGLSIIMGLTLASANAIVAVDLSTERLEAARALGATHTLVANEISLAEWAQANLDGGADFVFEAVGNAKVIDGLQGALGRGGAAVLVGMPGFEDRSSFSPYTLSDQGQRILGCNYGSSNALVDIPRLAQLYLNGRLPLDRILGEHRPLGEYEHAFRDLRAGIGLRSILVP